MKHDSLSFHPWLGKTNNWQDTGTRSKHKSFGLLKDLERPGDVFRDIGPNWFASVMGTGIVAIAAATLPFRVPGLHVFALVVWALSAAWLVLLSAAWAVHWTKYTERARAHANNPVMAQFWGAPAMALLTVGAGTLLVGRDWIGSGRRGRRRLGAVVPWDRARPGDRLLDPLPDDDAARDHSRTARSAAG